MNYKQNYFDYINYVKSLNRKRGKVYYEKHHIIPKCLGGTNEKDNLILLTGREHFLAHYLLCKIYPNNKKLLFAFAGMKRISKEQKRYINSRLYEKYKLKAVEAKGDKVVCIETGKVYNSVTQAEREVCFGVKEALKGKQLTAGGFHWKYLNKETKPKEPFQKKKVICAETKEIFNSTKEAANFAKVSNSYIRNVCNGYSYKASGYTFYYYEGEKDYKIKPNKRNT